MATDLRRRSALIAAALCLIAFDVRAQELDRTMAVVLSQPILLSDVNAARIFGLVQPPPGTKDPVAAVLDRLIERMLMLSETDRYQPPEPAPDEIDKRIGAIERRLGSAAFEKAMAATGMTRDRLREYLRNDLRITTYINQRFGGVAQPGDDEVLAYYREHPAEFTVNGVLQPYDAVVETIRSRLSDARRSTLIAEWVATLRRRADVTLLYLPK